jgi:hypothetical protein
MNRNISRLAAGALVALATAGLLAVRPAGANTPAVRTIGVDRPDVWMRHSGRQGGEPSGEYFGREMATGDFNGDGVTDLAVAAHYDGRPPDTSPGRGRVYVYFGRGGQFPALLDPADPACNCVISGSEPFAWFGTELVAGDFDGDGLDDLAVSENELPTVYQGRVYLVSGASMSSDIELRMDEGEYMSRIVGRTAGAEGGHYLFFGFSLTAGDFNGDGIADIAAGAFGGDGVAGSRGESGEAAVFLGRRGGWAREIVADVAGADLFIPGRASSLHFGNEIGAGDVDGDGRDDLVVAAWGGRGPDGSRPFAGEISIFSFGPAGTFTLPVPPDGPSEPAALFWDPLARPAPGTIHGPRTNARIGASASDGGGRGLDVGDFDGDGYQDLIVGVPFLGDPAANGKNAGAVYIVWGGPALTQNARLDLAEAAADQAAQATLLAVGGRGESLGDSVRAVDLNGDGRADLLVGAPDAAEKSGCAVVYAGRPRPSGPAAPGTPWLTTPEAVIWGNGAYPWRAGEDVIGLDPSFAGRALVALSIPEGGRFPFGGRGPAGEVAMFDATPLLASAPRVPFIEAQPRAVVAPGAPLDLTVEARGGAGVVAVTAEGLPAFASLAAVDPTAGRYALVLRPTDADRGTHVVTLVAVDAAGVSGTRRVTVVVGYEPTISRARAKRKSGQTYKLIVDGSGFAKGEAIVEVDGVPAANVKYPARFEANGGRTVTRVTATTNQFRDGSVVRVRNPREGLASNGVGVQP